MRGMADERCGYAPSDPSEYEATSVLVALSDDVFTAPAHGCTFGLGGCGDAEPTDGSDDGARHCPTRKRVSAPQTRH